MIHVLWRDYVIALPARRACVCANTYVASLLYI
jgi:hypothetical protein